MAIGAYDIKVNTNGMPQKIATAFGELADTHLGTEYTFVAYLGSQIVNGTNHAVLAEQTVITGKDTKNAVVVVFNEKPNAEVTLVSIERILESGGELGGVVVDVTTNIPEEAKTAFDEAFEGFVGSKVEPFALLGTQVTKGTSYIFAAEVTPVTPNPESKVALVVANGLTKKVNIIDFLTVKSDINGFGYAFTWVK